MKLKTTKKIIKENYSKIIGIGYCNFQYMLYYSNPFAFSAGVYGWCCDYYEFDNICISTGYSYISTVKTDYEFVRKYELKAQKIVLNYDLGFETKKAKLNNLMKKFIKEAVKNES
jgi:hypothetical protein